MVVTAYRPFSKHWLQTSLYGHPLWGFCQFFTGRVLHNTLAPWASTLSPFNPFKTGWKIFIQLDPYCAHMPWFGVDIRGQALSLIAWRYGKQESRASWLHWFFLGSKHLLSATVSTAFAGIPGHRANMWRKKKIGRLPGVCSCVGHSWPRTRRLRAERSLQWAACRCGHVSLLEHEPWDADHCVCCFFLLYL